jgi:hypothetical protein
MKKLSVVILMFFVTGKCLSIDMWGKDKEIVMLSETYELANIILAMTDYGKTDRWEVAQMSDYYREVRTYFDQYSNHPLLTKVNYSRAKWDSYLSFRTDAYAFVFDKDGNIVRAKNFYANEGLNPFEENLSLVNDFARTTGFRDFYQQHIKYYKGLAVAYLESQHYPEMLAFLQKEFGKRQTMVAYAITISPLVGRMNCHRTVEGVATDFITVPDFLLKSTEINKATDEEIASGTHMLFTELDHGFVNPLSLQYRELLKDHFSAEKWDAGSGYEKDSLASFNEYMTWALYDLYVQTYFPSVAAMVFVDWALQNETRGFYASALFNHELRKIYNGRKRGQTIKDLYPAFIKQIGALQVTLSKPTIVDQVNKTAEDSVILFTIRFSEPMQALPAIDVVCVTKLDNKTQLKKITLTVEDNALTWLENNTALRFGLKPMKGFANKMVFNYPWKTRATLKSGKGIHLAAYSSVVAN